ncbi:MAG: Tfp pilus assembly protein FimT/FimU [bacterium]
MSKKIWNEGMTLIELAVVVCIIGIVAAIAAPSVIGFMPRLKLSSQVSAIQNDIQRARIKSISLNTIYRIRFFLYSYPKTDGYRGYYYDATKKTWISDVEMLDENDDLFLKKINKSVDLAYIGSSGYSSGIYSMYFLSDGTCIARDIFFKNTVDQKKKIEIQENTGFMKIHDNW